MIEKYKDFYSELELLKQKNLYRKIRPPFFHSENNTIEKNGQHLINLSSNDYLGFAFDKDLIKSFIEKMNSENIENYYLASSGSRLLSGNSFAYEELEDKISLSYRRRSVIIFNSGYHANVGIIPALVGKEDGIFLDKLCHASIIDGVMLSGASFHRYNHLDYDHLETLLKKYRGNCKRAIIITESVFSMDGDIADIKILNGLKNRYNLLLYVDEAHAVGVFGNNGLGIAERENIISEVDLILGTFGKAFASIGSFLVCDKVIKEYLINKMRSFIYTTALPPMVLSWNRFVFEKSLSDNGASRRKHLNLISDNFRERLKENGFSTIGNSQIVPLVTFSNNSAIKFSEELIKKGFYALPVRYPTVPKGKSRIRFSITANLTENQLDNLVNALKEIKDAGMLALQD